MARLANVPEPMLAVFSKRAREAREAARELAREKGADWDSLSGDQQVALIKAGADETRQSKNRRSLADHGQSDFAVWHAQAVAAGYSHRSVLRPDEIKQAIGSKQRHAAAYAASQPVAPGKARLGHPSPGSRKGNERTHDVLPNPDKLISY